MKSREVALDRLYSLLGQLEATCGGMRRLKSSDSSDGWPRRGVYFFFEPGEVREDDVTPRVVRVGTHALRPSSSTLWGRLSQHRGTVGGRLPGGGNHRGSIFRLHVGTALLNSGDWSESIRSSWGVGGSADRATRETEYPLEKAVSDYIGNMPFLWLEVDDEPGPNSARGVIESGAISLLSNYHRAAVDPPSVGWLGRSADREMVRKSGLWNVNHVQDHYSDHFLDAVEERIP